MKGRLSIVIFLFYVGSIFDEFFGRLQVIILRCPMEIVLSCDVEEVTESEERDKSFAFLPN